MLLEKLNKKEVLDFQKRIREDPIWFAEEALKTSLWKKQKEILLALKDNQEVAVRSSNAAGKSFTAARAIHWWLLGNSDSIVITTAPCYDDKTEILTDEGWKLFKDLTLKDKVAQLKNEEVIEFVFPKKIFKYPFKGEMIGFKSQLIDLLITPNHRCYTKLKVSNYEGKWKIKRAEEIYGKEGWRFKKTAGWKNGEKQNKDKMEFYGFWFAEGYAQFNNLQRKYRITLTQKKKVDYVDNLIERNKFWLKNIHKYHRCDGAYNWEIYNKEMAKEFIVYGKQTVRKIPLWIKNSDRECLKAFIMGYLQGDGSIDKNGSTKLLTSSKQLADDLQEICIKAGYISNITFEKRKKYFFKNHLIKGTGLYSVRFWKKRGKEVKSHKKNWYKIKYEGYVYCVEVPSGIVLVRRNGKYCWSGNTWRQVKEILWREIKAAVAGKKFYPEKDILETKIDIDDRWFALGLSTDRVDQFQGFHCLSDDTEVLTNRGWKTVFDLDINDLVLSVPLGKTNSEWKPIQKIYIYPFKGELNVYDGKCVNFAVTDEHRFPTKYDSLCKNWSFKKFSELKTKFIVQRIISWEGENINIPKEFSEFTKERFAEFVGFWTGDGGTRQHSKSNFYEILFYQKKKDGIDYLENYLLKDLRYSKKQDYYSISNKAICKWLIDNVGRYQKDRRVPSIFRNSTPQIIKAYLKGLWRADGTFINGEPKELYSTSKELIDNIQEMLLKIGKPTTIGINKRVNDKRYPLVKNTCYVLSFTKEAANHVVLKRKIRKQYYEGNIWCLSTEYETFAARRNGRIFISGNSPNLMVVIDEASGVNDMIYEAIDGLKPNKILMIGNPLRNTGRFTKAFKEPNIAKIHISAFDTPNLINSGYNNFEKFQEDFTKQQFRKSEIVIPGLITLDDVIKFALRYGIESDVFRIRVLGEFPGAEADSFISIDEIEQAMNREVIIMPEWEKKLGVDVARYGTDRTVFIIRQMEKVLKKIIITKQDTMEIVGQIIKIAKGEFIRPRNIFIDIIGIGTGVVDRLREQDWRVNGINTALPAEDKEHYGNLRAELGGEFKGWLRTGQLLKDDDFYEIANLKYKFNSKGQMLLESKEDMRNRGLPSPDIFDALCLTFAKGQKVQMFQTQASGGIKPYTDLGF